MTQTQSIEAFDKTGSAGKQGTWPKLKLSPEHAKLWAETRAAVLWAQPAFADIWFAMMIDRNGEQAWFTDCIPTAATDDKIMYINPTWFFKLTLEERVFVACHEIAHAMFNHCGLFHRLRKQGHIRYADGITLPYVDDLMQCAADFVINAMNHDAKVGKMPKEGCLNLKLIPAGTGALDAYKILYKKAKKPKKPKGKGPKQPPGSGQGPSRPGNQPSDGDQEGKGGSTPESEVDMTKARENGDGTQGKAFDTHLEPGEGRGKTPSEAESERNPQQWENAIQAAMTSARLRGVLPGCLERMFLSVMEPKADWSELYLEAVSRKIGNDAYSWENMDQQMVIRGIGAPGRVQYGCELVIVACDTSGSINQETLNVFLGETRGIMDQVKPKRVIFVQCDAAVHEWKEITDINELDGKVKGGCGTAFQPVFDRVEEEGEHPDLLIYLTDLMGDNPKQPDYPVVWGCINNTVHPWGQTIRVPEQASEDTL